MKGDLILIPMTLGANNFEEVIPPHVKETIKNTRYFITENIRTTRRYFSALSIGIVIDELIFFEIDKHAKIQDLDRFLAPCLKGHDVGILSEAGVPGVADPGAEIAAEAHQRQIRVRPLTGPSSILLALMASGMNGQKFTFNGYLPVDKRERLQALKQLEKRSLSENTTQIFMETPYRNDKLMDDLLKILSPDTRLCVAADITLKSEFIETRNVKNWSENKPVLHKRPTIFLLQKSK
jgi:16S rRNA (cytidine1402-2'-O)-methyltransferase